MSIDLTEYRRDPLPHSARTPVGLVLVSVMALLCCPFFGFALEGKVGHAGLVRGLWMMPLPLAALAALAIRRALGWRRLPAELTRQWTHGKIFSPLHQAVQTQPACQEFEDGNLAIAVRPEGVTISQPTILQMARAEGLSHLWAAQQAGAYFLSWADIKEWRVESDSDGPDAHRLMLNGGGHVSVRRFTPRRRSEADLLDAVRTTGQCSVRLLVDLPPREPSPRTHRP